MLSILFFHKLERLHDIYMRSGIKVNIKEFLFYTAYIPLVTCAFFKTTTFVEIIDFNFIYNLFRMYAIGAFMLKTIVYDKLSNKSLFICMLTVVLGVLSYYQSGVASLMEFVILLFLARDVDIKRFIKVFFYWILFLLIFTMACALTGIITNYTTSRSDSNMLRYSFGIVYSTDFAAHIFFLILSYFYSVCKKIRLVDVLGCVVIVMLLDIYCDARLSELSILITAGLFFITRNLDLNINKTRVKLFSFLICIFSMVSVVIMTVFYNPDNPVLLFINLLTSRRLSVGKHVYDLYGLGLLGQRIIMQGQGFMTKSFDTQLGITYLDSSFVQILFLYGAFFYGLIMYLCIVFCNTAIKNNDLKLWMIILIIILSSTINQYLISYSYNPFMILMLSYCFNKRKQSSEGERKWKRVKI